jgi:hypothetical protein
VPSHGVHINGFVRDPENPADIKIWVRFYIYIYTMYKKYKALILTPTPTCTIILQVGKRASTKATYPGLLDVIAAGGQPSGLTFRSVGAM